MTGKEIYEWRKKKSNARRKKYAERRQKEFYEDRIEEHEKR